MEEFLNNSTPEEEDKIEEFLSIIGKIWKSNPELRFGQLIANCYAKGEDIYYKYDQDMIDDLLDRYL